MTLRQLRGLLVVPGDVRSASTPSLGHAAPARFKDRWEGEETAWSRSRSVNQVERVIAGARRSPARQESSRGGKWLKSA